MRFLAINDHGEMPIRYLAVTEEEYQDLRPDPANIDPEFIEITDPDVLSELDESIRLYESGHGMRVDVEGTFYTISSSPLNWGMWLITME